MNLSIPSPCSQDWNAMETSTNGGYCDLCNKTVVDFTGKTNEQILGYLEAQPGKTCGRIRKEQLQPMELQEIKIKPAYFSDLSYQKLFITALFVVFGTALFSCRDHDNKKVEIKAGVIDSITGEISMMKDSVAIDSGRVVQQDIKIDPVCIDPPEIMGEVALPDVEPDTMERNPEAPADILGGIELLPEFPGGAEKMYEFIRENLEYPEASSNRTGKVLVSFGISPDGIVKDARIVKGMGDPYDQAVIEMVAKMPGLKMPGNWRHKDDFRFMLPVRFGE